MDDLRQVLDYNQETGVFTWIGGARKGYTVSPSHSEGYLRVQFRGTRLFLHRVAYYWHTGEWPEEVDHIDRNPSNCKLSNLRAATQQQNSCNKGNRGSSRFRGVTWFKKNKKWGVSLRKNGKAHWVGLFSSEEEAARAYNKAAVEIHGSFASLNKV